VDFTQGARFGYLGTAYGALRKVGFQPGDTALVLGATGTLGVCAVVMALAMGASRVYGAGRNPALLERLQALAPARVRTIQTNAGSAAESVLGETDDFGVDVLVEALSPGVPAALLVDSFQAVRRGGSIVKIGGLAETVPVDPLFFMRRHLRFVGSNWFTTAQGQEMASLAAGGLLDLSWMDHVKFPLSRVNDAVAAVAARDAGGWTNVVVVPD
jgi:threonine dehydrogenase-like Zn-dependent dehydrogenase